MTKICKDCGIEYELNEGNFARVLRRNNKRGWECVCRKCMSIRKRKHYEKDIEKYKERAKKQRDENLERYLSYQKEYAKKNKEVLASKHKVYMATEQAKELGRKRSNKWWNNPKNRTYQVAHIAVRMALLNGTIVRPNECSLCSKQCKPEAHHSDYSRVLDITWLCKQCHVDAHHLNEGHRTIG